MKFSEIKYFQSPSYRINVSWSYLPKLLEDYERNNNSIYNPDFQRGYVWTEDQRIKYIEYILRGGVSGKEIYFNHPNWSSGLNEGDFILVDGKQRIDAVVKFLNNEIKIFNHYFKEFTDKMSMFRCEFLFNVNNLKNYNDVIEWYISMNAGGSVHTSEDIQRARNCIKR